MIKKMQSVWRERWALDTSADYRPGLGPLSIHGERSHCSHIRLEVCIKGKAHGQESTVRGYPLLGPSCRRFRDGERGAGLAVTNLWAMLSKSRNTPGLTRDRRTRTAL